MELSTKLKSGTNSEASRIDDKLTLRLLSEAQISQQDKGGLKTALAAQEILESIASQLINILGSRKKQQQYLKDLKGAVYQFAETCKAKGLKIGELAVDLLLQTNAQLILTDAELKTGSPGTDYKLVATRAFNYVRVVDLFARSTRSDIFGVETQDAVSFLGNIGYDCRAFHANALMLAVSILKASKKGVSLGFCREIVYPLILCVAKNREEPHLASDNLTKIFERFEGQLSVADFKRVLGLIRSIGEKTDNVSTLLLARLINSSDFRKTLESEANSRLIFPAFSTKEQQAA